MKAQTKKYIALGLIFLIIHLAIFVLYQIAMPDIANTSEKNKVSALHISVDTPSWTSQKTALVQIVINDPYQAGVKRVEYKVGSGKWIDAPADLKVPVESDCNLSVRATDSFDATAITNKYLQCFDQAEPELINVQQQDDKIAITATDALSGVSAVIVNGMEYISHSQTDGDVSVTVDALGVASLDIQVKDVAGNTSEMQSFTVARPKTVFDVQKANIPASNSHIPAAAHKDNAPSSGAAAHSAEILAPQIEPKKSTSLLDGIFSGKSAEAKAKKQASPMDGLINTALIFAACAVIGFGYMFIKDKLGQKSYDDKDFIMYEDDEEKEADSFDIGGIVYEV